MAPSALFAAPWWLYLGGVCGLLALLINVTSLQKLSLFESTTVLLVGQLVGAVALDALLWGNVRPLKVFGVAVLGAGVVWDKRICARKAA